MMSTVYLFLALLGELPGEPLFIADTAEHVKVYYEPGRFGGWRTMVSGVGGRDSGRYSRGYYKDLGATPSYRP